MIDSATAPEKLPNLLTVNEAATVLRISHDLVYRLIKSGELPSTKIGRLAFLYKSGVVAMLTGRTPLKLVKRRAS